MNHKEYIQFLLGYYSIGTMISPRAEDSLSFRTFDGWSTEATPYWENSMYYNDYTKTIRYSHPETGNWQSHTITDIFNVSMALGKDFRYNYEKY